MLKRQRQRQRQRHATPGDRRRGRSQNQRSLACVRRTPGVSGKRDTTTIK
jgi:ERCC4-type nuclease